MKLAFFNDFRLGVVKENNIVDVTGELNDIPHLEPQQMMKGLIENFDQYRSRLEKAVAESSGVPLTSVRLRPPLPRPASIECMASNYMEGGARKEIPAINAFPKPPSAIIGQGDEMVLPDTPASVFEGEAEIAVVFGRTACNVREEDAFDYVFGYTNFVDGSARGIGPERNIFFVMKARDTFAPIGPYIVTKDEIPDPQNVNVRLWNNGQLRQDYNTNDMIYSIARSIAWLTSIHTMYAGDILAMGTNHGGLHAFQDGDKIEIETDGLGRLAFCVRDDLKRTWTRETHHDREKQGFSGMKNLLATQLTGKYKPES